MSALSEQQLAAIRAQLGDAQPATDGLLVSFGKSIADRREHSHPKWEDFFCMNLSAYMGERAAPVLRRLLDAEARLAELEAAARTAWLASHDSDGTTFGHYLTRTAAMDHIHHLLAREENAAVEAIQTRVIWRADDPTGPEDAETGWECWLFDSDMSDDAPTGYVVSPVTVAAAYDPDGDE